ncbi:DUF2970 domain-containing protein [Methylonatrum kenyense]|uniref:DUF2970 domain-containing protein n=1 Tax=Methylonatrum kenyense TaxID=455253 RepID=UPI0020BE6856|nr:DUF2970 domain-containing protein [Methylonatrum kenyense]MCK8516511.1 DUF2970 domain-containing protein [Methylonatrum kenyense]
MQEKRRPTFWQYLLSILAAAFGVQSQAARERDFTYGNPRVFIFGGILFTLTFIGILALVVFLVVP